MSHVDIALFAGVEYRLQLPSLISFRWKISENRALKLAESHVLNAIDKKCVSGLITTRLEEWVQQALFTRIRSIQLVKPNAQAEWD